MNKKQYETPTIEIVELEVEDIVSLSSGSKWFGDQENPGYGNDNSTLGG